MMISLPFKRRLFTVMDVVIIDKKYIRGENLSLGFPRSQTVNPSSSTAHTLAGPWMFRSRERQRAMERERVEVVECCCYCGAQRDKKETTQRTLLENVSRCRDGERNIKRFLLVKNEKTIGRTFHLSRKCFISFPHRAWCDGGKSFPIELVVCQYFSSFFFPFFPVLLTLEWVGKGSSYGDGLFMTHEALCHLLSNRKNLLFAWYVRRGWKFITTIFCELSLFMANLIFFLRSRHMNKQLTVCGGEWEINPSRCCSLLCCVLAVFTIW